MPILTAQQPIVRAPDTAQLASTAFDMITKGIVLGQQAAAASQQRRQQDFIQAAQLRQEISKAGNDRYDQERQLRNDELNKRIQLAQDARAERQLQITDKYAPLLVQGKILDNVAQGLSNQKAVAILPYAAPAAALGVANDALQSRGLSLQNDSRELALEVDRAQAPVELDEAALKMQRMNRAKVASSSLQNVTGLEEYKGWLDGNFADLPGDQSQQLADVNRFIGGKDWTENDKARARALAENAVNASKIADSNTGLFPETEVTSIAKMLLDGSKSTTDSRGRRQMIGDYTLDGVNAALKLLDREPITPQQYAALPKSPPTSAEAGRDKANLSILTRAKMARANEYLDIAKEYEDKENKTEADKYRKLGLDLLEQVEREAQESIADPGAPAPPPAVTPAPAAMPAAPINPRRAAALGALGAPSR